MDPRGKKLWAYRNPLKNMIFRGRLLRNGHVVTRQVAEVSDDGIATLTLPSTAAGRHALKRGTYTIQVTPGLRPGQYGVTTTRRMRIQ